MPVPRNPPAYREITIVRRPKRGPSMAVVADTVAPSAVPSQIIAIEVGKSSVKYCKERDNVNKAKMRKGLRTYQRAEKPSTET